MNSYQEAYFRLMTQTREHVFYVSEHIVSADKWNSRISMFMAIASSSSIGAWVIWQQLSWIWASIIAASQVVGAIKGHLPFKRRLLILYPLRNELERLSLEMEKEWYSVANGEMTEREIHTRTTDLRAKKASIEQKHLNGMVLPERASFIGRAKARSVVHFENCLVGDNR